eukprot:589186-Pelagomonas_calceolata.AAC.1
MLKAAAVLLQETLLGEVDKVIEFYPLRDRSLFSCPLHSTTFAGITGGDSWRQLIPGQDMSKKARLSAEDKRNIVLSIFHETADVYVLKDVEKLGSKKGINSMLIKEILQVGPPIQA